MEQRSCETRTYEGMFMLDPTKATQEWDNIKKQIIGLIEKKGGSIINAKKWGERKLAYEIKRHKRAVYLLIYFQLPSLNLGELRKDLQLSELVMRFLVVVREKITPEEQQHSADSETVENIPASPDTQAPQSPANPN